MAITTSRHEVGGCRRGHHEVRAYNSATGGGPPWLGDVPMWGRAGHQEDPPTVSRGTRILSTSLVRALGPEPVQQVLYWRPPP